METKPKIYLLMPCFSAYYVSSYAFIWYCDFLKLSENNRSFNNQNRIKTDAVWRLHDYVTDCYEL